jgi:hypothetical protein
VAQGHQQLRRLLHRAAAALVQVVPLRAQQCAVQRRAQRRDGHGPAARIHGSKQLRHERGRRPLRGVLRVVQLRAQHVAARRRQRRQQLRQLHALPLARLLLRQALRRAQQRGGQAQRQRARGVAARALPPRRHHRPDVRGDCGRDAQLVAHELVERVARSNAGVHQRAAGGVQLESRGRQLVLQVCVPFHSRAGRPRGVSTRTQLADAQRPRAAHLWKAE